MITHPVQIGTPSYLEDFKNFLVSSSKIINQYLRSFYQIKTKLGITLYILQCVPNRIHCTKVLVSGVL